MKLSRRLLSLVPYPAAAAAGAAAVAAASFGLDPQDLQTPVPQVTWPYYPWRCGWPRCWGRHPAGSPRRSEGTLGLASRHSHLPPVQLRYSIYYTQLLYGSLILPLKLKMHCQCDSPSALGVGTPASAAEAAAALRASSSCLCRCSSIDTRRA
uniref:Secreted protein n=1 Tax=Neolamprologus brichardi TaxID=32507 RepID=A0A3Q4HES6_NEOBR